MTWLKVAFLKSLAVTTIFAHPFAPEVVSLDRRATFSEIAKFDGLATNAAVPLPYKRLNYTHLTVQSTTSGGHTRSLTPFSSPNYVVTAPGSGQSLADAPTLSVVGTKTTNFTFSEFEYACLDARQGKKQIPVNCEFTVTGLTQGPTGHQGPILVTYAPASGDRVGMMSNQPVSFHGVTSVYWLLYTSDAGLANTILVFDDVKYTAYTN